MPPVMKAIGPFVPQQPVTSPKDWILVRLEPSNEKVYLPYGTRVEFSRVESNRDYFKVLDFEYQNKAASLSHQQTGGTYTSRLIEPLNYLGPAKIDWNAGTQKVSVSVPSNIVIVPIEAAGVSDTDPSKLPNGTFKLRPRMEVFDPGAPQRPGDPPGLRDIYEGYLKIAPHFYSWWLIEHMPERGFFFHTGRRSIGCVTVTEVAKWESIYQLLIRCRTPDYKFIGEITISGHSRA